MYEVVIVGGSAAGLSAALVLGRSLRNVLVCDTNQPRNGSAPTSHSLYTRDGAPSADLTAIGRAQLERYDVELRSVAVTQVRSVDQHAFLITLANGEQVRTRRVLLATGVRDVLPPLAGIEQFWGTSVVHCPYCHGWEVRNQPIAVLSAGGIAISFVYLLRNWSRPGQAYIHFVGIHPEQRKRGLGRQLYELFFATVRARGCDSVHCITAPINSGSIAFHTCMGFQIEKSDHERDGVPYTTDYDGPGQDRVLFVKSIF